MASNYELKIEKILRMGRCIYKKEVSVQGLNGARTTPLRFDFQILRPYNCFIEVDGEYHFKPIRGILPFRRQTAYDEKKNAYCLGHNILLIRIPYWEIDNIKTINDIFNNPHFVVKSKYHNYMLKQPY